MIHRSIGTGSRAPLSGGYWNNVQAASTKDQQGFLTKSIQNLHLTIPHLPPAPTPQQALRFEQKLTEFQLKFEVAQAAITIFGQAQAGAMV